jgi:hypothetical protein
MTASVTKWRVLTVVTTATATMMAWGASTNAADQVIAGKKLLLKDKKFVLISKDPTITSAGANPVGGGDSSITFSDGSASVRLALPATLWKANRAGTAFKYKDSGPTLV